MANMEPNSNITPRANSEIDQSSLLDKTEESKKQIKARNDFINAKLSYMQTETYRTKLIKSKLKAVTRTSALLSGFAMVAMVELSLDFDPDDKATNLVAIEGLISKCRSNKNLTQTEILDCNNQIKIQELNEQLIAEQTHNRLPMWILVVYAVITCLLVGIHMLALMISTCILPQIEASTVDSEVNGERNISSPAFALATASLNINTTTKNDPSMKYLDLLVAPDRHFRRYIELAWISSTVIGIFLFLVEISLVCFIKFYPINASAAILGGIFMIPIVCLFVMFTYTFYKSLAIHKLNLTKEFINQVDRHMSPLHEQIV